MPGKKTQATILVNPKKPKIIDFDDFLDRIFYRRPSMKITAKRLIEQIAKGKVTRESWQEMAKELGVAPSVYYYILSRLRALGLVARVEGEYILSMRFTKALKEMAEWWESFVERAKEEGKVRRAGEVLAR